MVTSEPTHPISDELPLNALAQAGGNARERLEQAQAALERDGYELRLYITGMTPRASQAISAIKSICESYLAGRYDLQVIDIAAAPELARSAQIVAAPTLVKSMPLPPRRLIGNLSDTARVLHALDMPPVER